MSDQTLQPISAVSALIQARIELQAGFAFEQYSVPLDAIDLEHFRKALSFIELLLAAQAGKP